MSADRLPATTDWAPVRQGGYPALIGPFLFRRDPAGTLVFAFVAEARHLNLGGVVHGGMLTSFADDVLGMSVWEAAGRRACTTVQLNMHFIAPAREGDRIEGQAEILRITRSVVFVRGTLRCGDRLIAAADGVWKLLGTA